MSRIYKLFSLEIKLTRYDLKSISSSFFLERFFLVMVITNNEGKGDHILVIINKSRHGQYLRSEIKRELGSFISFLASALSYLFYCIRYTIIEYSKLDNQIKTLNITVC